MPDPSDRADGPPPTPRWVRNLVLALAAVAVAVVLLVLLVGGDHGPGRHGALGTGGSPVAAPTALP